MDGAQCTVCVYVLQTESTVAMNDSTCLHLHYCAMVFSIYAFCLPTCTCIVLLQHLTPLVLQALCYVICCSTTQPVLQFRIETGRTLPLLIKINTRLCCCCGDITVPIYIELCFYLSCATENHKSNPNRWLCVMEFPQWVQQVLYLLCSCDTISSQQSV